MKVSCLCVTEDRPAFIPWLVWNFEKQTWTDKELVVIDSSKEPIQDLFPEGVIYEHMEHGTYIPVKRNRALNTCKGDVVTWMDDDDWQHPRKCEILAETLQANPDAKVAGSRFKYSLDLETLLTNCTKTRLPVFGSIGIYRDQARSCLFPTQSVQHSDSYWLCSMSRLFYRNLVVIEEEILLIGLCHDTNITNTRGMKKCDKTFFWMKDEIATEDWEKTSDHLTSLRQKLSIEGPEIKELSEPVSSPVESQSQAALALKRPTQEVHRSPSPWPPKPLFIPGSIPGTVVDDRVARPAEEVQKEGIPKRVVATQGREFQKSRVTSKNFVASELQGKKLVSYDVERLFGPEYQVRKVFPEICVVITTYNRPLLLLDLFSDIKKQGKEVDVRVYDDASATDYAVVIEEIRRQKGWCYVRANRNYGKRNFKDWISRIYQELQDCQSRYFIFLPDDVRLCQNFFERVVEIWRNIEDLKKICMTLLVDNSRVDSSCWTKVRPDRRGHVDHIGWVDGCFICERLYLETLTYRVPFIQESWFSVRSRGSGVGSAISKFLYKKGLQMYRVYNSLVCHVAAPSMMNSQRRRVDPLITTRFVDGPTEARLLSVKEPVTVSLASIPSRVEGLRRVVDSLRGQADVLNVYLNGYDEVPEFLGEGWINVMCSQENGDKGDGGKFWWADQIEKGYHFTCDDDLIYSPDYCLRMVEKIESYHRKAVIGMHGAILKEKLKSYIGERKLFHCQAELGKDQPVHVLGTGCLAYHTSTLNVSVEDFKFSNMADIWFAILAKRQAVPLIVSAHPKGILEVIPFENTIYDVTKRCGDGKQTELLNAESPWPMLKLPSNVESPRSILKLPSSLQEGRKREMVHTASAQVRSSSNFVSFSYKGRSYTFAHPSFDDHIGSTMRELGRFYEMDLLEAISAEGRKGVYLDVGAHVGNHAVYFANECSSTSVVAIEASQETFSFLQQNMARNVDKPFQLFAGIVGNTGQKAKLVRQDTKNTGMDKAYLVEDGDEVLTIDSLAQKIAEKIAVIKIDVEGFEEWVIKGAFFTLRKYRPLLAIETHSKECLQNHSILLGRLGYKLGDFYGYTPIYLWRPN